MKVLQVISYGYLAGGAEKSVFLLRDTLRRRGHEVMVATSDHNKDGSEIRFSDIEFPEIDGPGVSLFTKTIKHLWYKPSYRAIRTAVNEFKPDIVHFHVLGQLSPSAVFAIGKVPGLLTVHGPEEYVSSLLEWGLPRHLFRNERVDRSNLTTLGKAYYVYFRYAQRPLYTLAFRRHLKAIIAPSKYMHAQLTKERYHIPLYQLYNGIKLPKQQPLQEKNRLLYVGRLEHVKGVDVLIRAMPEIIKRVPDVRLSIIGDGALRVELEAFTKQKKLQKHVRFYGWLEPEAVNQQYAKTTAVVIPSIWPENLPTVCIEALAMGRPVVGTRTGGIPELIQDGVTGRVVAIGNVRELTMAIVELLSRSDLPAISKHCADSMQNFKDAKFTQNIERLYRHIIDTTQEDA